MLFSTHILRLLLVFRSIIVSESLQISVLFVVHDWKPGETQTTKNRGDILDFLKNEIFPRTERIFSNESRGKVKFKFKLFPEIVRYDKFWSDHDNNKLEPIDRGFCYYSKQLVTRICESRRFKQFRPESHDYYISIHPYTKFALIR